MSFDELVGVYWPPAKPLHARGKKAQAVEAKRAQADSLVLVRKDGTEIVLPDLRGASQDVFHMMRLIIYGKTVNQ
jgi:hypothetical protein